MKMTAYVDGSYNAKLGVYGAGAVIFVDGNEEELIKVNQAGSLKEFVSARNVAGEVLAVIMVMNGIKTLLDVEQLTIYYDYDGIKCWPSGDWRCFAPVSKYYKSYMDTVEIPIVFKKVKAHSGVPLNEMADALAKRACGL